MQSLANTPLGNDASVGWIGTGRMGQAMADRLLRAGADLSVYNRTRAKTEALVSDGAKAVDRVTELSDRDVVFITVASSDDLLAVLGGEGGLLTGPTVPRIVVDCSTVSPEASAEARAMAVERGVELLAAPVSGNPKVVRAGKLTMVVSGPRPAFDAVEARLCQMASEVTYVGDGDLSRLVKLCHNLLLGVVIEALAEITVLAERGGVSRHDFLAFLNSSVMGSTFTKYKSPALVNLEFKPTFTTKLLRKDFDLGLAAGRELGVPMPVAALVHQLLQAAIGEGIGEMDFAALIGLVANGAGVELESEDYPVDDGLAPDASPPAPGGLGAGG